MLNKDLTTSALRAKLDKTNNKLKTCPIKQKGKYKRLQKTIDSIELEILKRILSGEIGPDKKAA